MEERKEILMRLEPDTVKALGDNQIEVIVSTERDDYHGEKINFDGIDIKQYHGTVLYGHDYFDRFPIGKAIKVWKDHKNRALKAIVQFAVEEYELAATVYKLIKGGYLTDVSIGGLVTKWSEDYSTIEAMVMKEFSVVPIGANADAVITAIGKSMDSFRSEYVDALNKHLRSKVKQLPENEIKEAINSMKKILAALEGEVESVQEDHASGLVNRVKIITLKNHAKELDKQAESIIKKVKLIKMGG